jgi:hypothetical protein
MNKMNRLIKKMRNIEGVEFLSGNDVEPIANEIKTELIKNGIGKQQHTNVSVNKTWKIHLGQPIDYNTLNGVAVYDSNRDTVDIEKVIDADKKSLIVSPKCGAWGRGLDYILKIKNVDTILGDELKEPVTLKFSTEGKSFTPSGSYSEDEKYIYEHYSKAIWKEQGGYTGYNCYRLIADRNEGNIIVYLYTDTFGLGNIVNAAKDNVTKAMDQQLEAIYKYMKNKYPNETINVGLYFKESLNKYPTGANSRDVKFDESTRKYCHLLLLTGRNHDGRKYFITEKQKEGVLWEQ